MRTIFCDEPQLARAVFEQDQVFCKQAHLERPLVFDFIGRRKWLPIPSHQFAHGSTLAHLSQYFILLYSFHGLKPLRLIKRQLGRIDPYWAEKLKDSICLVT